MKAKDLMIPLEEHLRPETTLREAVNLLRSARRGGERIGVKGLPVLDPAGHMIGFLSMGDILKAVLPFYMSNLSLGEFSWQGMEEDIARKSADRQVGELMTRKVISVHEDSHLMACVESMVKNNVKSLPVLNREDRVVGMLYEADVFFAITRMMLQEDGESKR
ncbi:MAG: hypothetical protein Kow0089_15580 [Desulfobulbaceae bacterium]